MLLNKLQDENKELFLRLEMLLVNIDGKYCDSERRLVEQHCREMGIQPIEYDKTVTIEKIAETINREMSVEERKIILIELITVAIIDGVYDEREKEREAEETAIMNATHAKRSWRTCFGISSKIN